MRMRLLASTIVQSLVISSASYAAVTGGLYDPLAFGAYYDGSTHTVQSTLGVSTIAGIQAYKPSSGPYAGTQPYAFLNTGNFVHQATLPILTSTAAGQALVMLSKYITISAVDANDPKHFLMAAGGMSGIRSGYVVNVTHSANGITGTYTIGQVAKQSTDGANNGFTTTVAPNAALAVGDTFMVGPNIAELSNAVLAGVTIKVSDGGNSIPANATITGVNTTTGNVRISSNLTSATTAFDGIDVTWAYTDAEGAAMTMDSLATNAAVSYSETHGGGIVELPAGSGEFSAAIDMPTVNQTMTVFPTSPRATSVAGAGMGATLLQATSDFGPGQYLVSCPQRLTSTMCGESFHDATLLGPAAANGYSVGASLAQMSGIGVSGRLNVHDVYTVAFSDGLAITGDQSHLENLYSINDYDALHWDYNQYNGLMANFLVDNVIANQNADAMLAIGPNVVVAGSTLIKLTDGAGPYGIEKETGGTQSEALADDHITWLQCEFVGIACRGEDRPYLNTTSNDTNVDYRDVEFQAAANSGFNPTDGLGKPDAAFEMAQGVKVRIEPADTYNWLNVAEGLFNIANANYGVTIHGDIQSLLNNNTSIFGPAAVTSQKGVIGWDFEDANWHAHPVYWSNLPTHELICDQNGLVACAGTTADDVVGVNLQVSSANMNANLVLDRGAINPNAANFTLAFSGGFSGYLYAPAALCTASGGAVQACYTASGSPVSGAGRFIGTTDNSGDRWANIVTNAR